MPLKLKETIYQRHIISLKILTGGSQTSWLFTIMTEKQNLSLPRNNSS